MKRIFRRPSPAMVIAMVALFAALGGTAVGAKVLNKKTVTKIANTQANQVFDQRAGRITRVEGPTVVVPPGGVDSASATCPPGQGIVSGGVSFISPGGEVFFEDTFGSGNSWSVGGDNFDAQFVSGDLNAIAFCAPSGKAVTAASAARVRERTNAAVARQKAMHGL